MNITRTLAPAALLAALAAPTTAAAQVVPAGLICLNRDAQVCDAVNELQLVVNAEVGSNVIAQSSSATRMRPTNIYNRLLQVKNAAVAGGCTIEGYSGGVYDAAAGGPQVWSGRLETLDGLESYDADGVCTLTPNAWNGLADDGVTQLDIGDVVGLHNEVGQIAGNVEQSGFKAGYWLRIAGNQGVFVTLTGQCPGDAGDALDPWWVGDLDSFGAPPLVGDTCATIKASNPSAPSGIYTVDPDGAGGNPPEQAYCDMRGSGVTYLHLLFGSINQSLPGGSLIQFTEYQDPVLQEAFRFVYNKDGGGLNVAPGSFSTGNCAFKAGGIPAGNYLKFGGALFVGPSTDGATFSCLPTYPNPGSIRMYLFDTAVVNPLGPTFFADNPPSFSPCCGDSENPAYFWQRLP